MTVLSAAEGWMWFDLIRTVRIPVILRLLTGFESAVWTGSSCTLLATSHTFFSVLNITAVTASTTSSAKLKYFSQASYCSVMTAHLLSTPSQQIHTENVDGMIIFLMRYSATVNGYGHGLLMRVTKLHFYFVFPWYILSCFIFIFFKFLLGWGFSFSSTVSWLWSVNRGCNYWL